MELAEEQASLALLLGAVLVVGTAICIEGLFSYTATQRDRRANQKHVALFAIVAFIFLLMAIGLVRLVVLAGQIG